MDSSDDDLENVAAAGPADETSPAPAADEKAGGGAAAAAFADSDDDGDEEDGEDDDDADDNDDDGDDDDDDDDEEPRSKKTKFVDDGDDFDDSEDDEDFEDEDEEEQKEKAKAKKRGNKRATANDFMIDDVDVADSDEDEEEEMGEMTKEQQEKLEQEATERRERRQKDFEAQRAQVKAYADEFGSDEEFDHQKLDQLRDEHDAQRQAAEAQKRAAERARREEIEGDLAAGDRPELELLPSVNDPNVWKVQCKRGFEVEACIQIMRRFFERQHTDNPLLIKSAFANPTPGPAQKSAKTYVYVEAFKLAHVKDAIKGLSSCQYGQWKQEMVRRDALPDTVRVVRKAALKEGNWVRMRSAAYKGDIARVVRVLDRQRKIEVRLIPRIDYNKYDNSAPREKRKRKTRPLPQVFDGVKMSEKGLEVEEDEESGKMYFDNKVFFNGFLEMQVNLTQLETVSIKPTLKELREFENAMEDSADTGVSKVDTELNQFAVSDIVEVVEGDLINLVGKVLSVKGDVVRIQPHHEDLTDALEFDFRQLIKSFKVSDHIEVTNGTYTGETGLVMHVGDTAITVMSDVTKKEFKVRANDIKLAIGQSKGLEVLGQFELHDLVSLDARNVGVIIRIERDRLFLLDQNGQGREVRPQQVEKRKPGRATALDVEQNEITKSAMVKVIDGAYKGRDGRVIHVYRSFVFIFKREVLENNGVFVARSRHLAASGSGRRRDAMQSFGRKMVPSSPRLHDAGGRGGGRGGRGGRGRGGPRRRHELIHKTVRITQGSDKGYIGIVKDATETHARVEIHATYKTKMIEIKKLVVFNDSKGATAAYPTGSLPSLGSRTPAYGSQTPAYGSQTPMHGGATPAYGAQTPRYGGATPSHDGSRTPSRGDATPGYQSGGAWDPSAAEPEPSTTPSDPYGGATPAGATPGGASEWDDAESTSKGYGSQSPYVSNDGGAAAAASSAPPTPGNPGTPADQYDYDYNSGSYASGTPDTYNTYGTTPGATPGATPGQTPGGTMMTPADTFTPSGGAYGTPQTDAYGTPQTDAYGTPQTDAYGTPQEGYTPSQGTPQANAWLSLGIYVRSTSGGISGVVIYVGGDTCTVRQEHGDEVSLPKYDLEPVRPDTKLEMVKVLEKDYRNAVGQVLNFEGFEAIVRLNVDDAEGGLVRILGKDILVKYDPNVGQ